MTINLLGITPNPSVETSVDVPPIVTSVTPLNGTVGTVVAVNISNFGDNDPSNVNLWLGDFYCGMVPGFDKGIIPCMVPDGGGSNLPIFVIVNTVRFQTPFNFSYFPPEIASVSPANASTTGPISFTIVGRYFGRCDYLCGVLNGFPNLEITVGGVRCNDIRHYDTDLTCSVQQGIAGIDLDVIVSYYGHNSSTSSVAKYSSLNFGPPDTMVSLIFRTSDGLNYSACYSSVSLNHNSMN
ncbi:hypothetical protein BKA69DRAFT_289729 [Paraphysoderma sedebokerense]|nr:hypothetical protein BKA69DRAFT_289729 [Paraphysoderma sedebokerense]